MKTVVVGPSWSPLASTLAQRLQSSLVSVEFHQFADTECFLRLNPNISMAQATVLVVFQAHLGNTPGGCFVNQASSGSLNDQLMALFSLLDIIQQQAPAAIHLVMPYMPYSRQAISHEDSYQGGAYTLGRCLKALGVTTLVVAELHDPPMATNFPVKIINLPTDDYWADIIKKMIVGQSGCDNWCVVSPDKGGRLRVEAIAKLLGLPTAFMRKTRVAADQPEIHELVGDVQGKCVIIVDDIIDTARTLTAACQLLKKHGAQTMVTCNTHAIVKAEACQRLLNSGCHQAWVTDSVINTYIQPTERLNMDSGQGPGMTMISHSNDRLKVVSINDFIVQQVVNLLKV